MCGFVGFLSPQTAQWGKTVLQRMASSIARRGPDDSGYWFDGDGDGGPRVVRDGYHHQRLV